MKRVVRSLLLFFCTTLFMLSATVCVCVVRVHADTASTYLNFSSNDCIEIYRGTNGRYITSASFSDDVRVLILNHRLYAVSKNNFTYYVGYQQQYVQSCGVPNKTDYISTSTYNSEIYYVYSGVTVPNDGIRNELIPFISDSTHVQDAGAIYYTFGEGSVDPVDPITWGLVDVKGYQTNIAGQGQAAIHNVDVISWDNSIDTNGNDITDGNVRIRVIPGEYRGTSKNDLLSKGNSDFILDIQHATAGNVVPVTNGSISYKWSDVIDALNFSSMSIFNTLHDNDTWFKRGWIYEIRLEIDDYIGEWQTIYASTSSGVENDLTIVNTSVITQNTITAIQQINSINSTTNIWIVNGQPVDPNPEQEPPASDDEKPWWVYLLEMINNTLGIQNEYINEGTDESIEVVNNFEDDHTELNMTVNDYDDIENDLVLDMNNNLEQIEVDSDLIENNSFLSSARWVAEQYTTIVNDNPIGSILKFSLVLGFVMIFLGRFK